MFDRRNILKFLLAGAAGSLLTPLPWKLLDDSAVWTQNWPWIASGRAGEITFKRTSSKLCPSAAGMRIQLAGGRPIRALPDPDHPLSLGGISPLALAEIQLLYSPARVRTPLQRGPDGSLRPIDEAHALVLLVAALNKARERGNRDSVMCLCGDETGSIREVLSLLLRTLNSEAFYFMPSELQPHALAARASGLDGLPCYNLEDSDCVFCLGADILESWGTIMRNQHVQSARRAPGSASSASRLVYCGPLRNATAVAADQWLPLKPGTEEILLLGLANLVLTDKAGLALATSPIAAWTAARVSAITGTSPAVLKELAHALSRAQRPLIITGSLAGQGGGTGLARLGFALNRLLGGSSLKFMPGPEPVLAGAAKFADLACRDIYAQAVKGQGTGGQGAGGQGKTGPEVLICYDANPIYAMPAAARTTLRLKDIPYKVVFSSFLDETSLAADLVFPLPLGLERLDDVYTPFGSGQIVYSLCPPVVKPAFGGPSPADVLFQTLTALGASIRAADGQKINDLEGLLRCKGTQLGADFRSLWRGEAFSAAPRSLARILTPPDESMAAALRELERCAEIITRAGNTALPPAEELSIAPFTRLALGTAESGIPPYAAGIMAESELQGGELIVRINGRTARRLKLANGQRVSLSAAGGGGAAPARLNACLAIFEGIMDDVIGLPLGGGHTAFDEFSQGQGVNGLDLYSLLPQERGKDGEDGGTGSYLAVRGFEIKGM